MVEPIKLRHLKKLHIRDVLAHVAQWNGVRSAGFVCSRESCRVFRVGRIEGTPETNNPGNKMLFCATLLAITDSSTVKDWNDLPLNFYSIPNLSIFSNTINAHT